MGKISPKILQHIDAIGAFHMRVLNLVDHLHHGGVQRMAVNVANGLSENGIESHLCSILDQGDLSSLVSPEVHYRSFSAASLYSLDAARQLREYIESEAIDLLHVHHRALFTAFFSFLFRQKIKVVWHDHYGRQDVRNRPWLVYALLLTKVDGIISVSHALKNWAVHTMRFPESSVRFIPNFIAPPGNASPEVLPDLPGKAGSRVVCVANFRPHKDHFSLIHGFKAVLEELPNLHLLLVGKIEDENYFRKVKKEIEFLSLNDHVSILGEILDITPVLARSDIGVLSSVSEGLPLALIEYGYSGLPVICTDVGDCSWLIKEKVRGLIMQPGVPEQLASGIRYLCNNPDQARLFTKNLKDFIRTNLNGGEILNQVIRFYDEILSLQ